MTGATKINTRRLFQVRVFQPGHTFGAQIGHKCRLRPETRRPEPSCGYGALVCAPPGTLEVVCVVIDPVQAKRARRASGRQAISFAMTVHCRCLPDSGARTIVSVHNPPANQAPSVSQVLRPLRDATASLHAALDARLPIARESASLRDYVDHLTAPRQPGVAALDKVAQRVAGRLSALDADLQDAGAIPGVPYGGRLSQDAATLGFTASNNAAFAWGLAYVFEGSLLGGRVMHRRLGARLAPHPMRYFAGEAAGETAIPHWPAFVAQIGAVLEDPAAIEAAQQGAVAGFSKLFQSFHLPLPAAIEAMP